MSDCPDLDPYCLTLIGLLKEYIDCLILSEKIKEITQMRNMTEKLQPISFTYQSIIYTKFCQIPFVFSKDIE